MKDQSIVVDPQVYTRTAALFALKRSTLSPQAVEGLAREIVSRVARAASARAQPGDYPICAASVAQFCDLLLEPDQPAVTLTFIEARRAEGATMQDVFLGYIGEAARLLGTRWEAGTLTPFEVTLGAGNLYGLMRALRARRGLTAHDVDDRRAALFATVPGEQHGIGITVAADMFREAGWDIDLQLGLDQEALVARVEHKAPQIVGLTLSTRSRLPDLLRLVVAMRIMAPDTLIGVAPAGELTADDLRDIADVDLLFRDAASALADLESIARSAP